MFNTKTLAASFLTLAACTTEPMVELAPEQATDALSAAQSLGIVGKASRLGWVVLAATATEPGSGEPAESDEGTPWAPGQEPVEPETGDEMPEDDSDDAGAEEPDPGTPQVFEGMYKTYITAIDEHAFGIEVGPSENFEIIREPEGFRINGFVTVHRGGDAESVNKFYGHGRAIFVQPETGCEIEWSRNIEGTIGEEGAAEAFVRDHAVYLDRDCAPEGSEGGDAFASYEIELSRL